MAYTTTQLIVDSYILSGIVSDQLQTVTGRQVAKGLKLLNSFISMKTVNSRMIPYFTKYQFNAVVAQEEYFIPNLIYIETLTFDYSSVRWSMEQLSRRVYQGSARANNIDSLMFNYYVERCKGGANLFMYFKPDKTYPMTIWGKFSLSSIQSGQDLSTSLDLFFIEYMRYGLAELICADANITFQPQNKAKLEEYEEQLLDPSTPDLTIKKFSGLSGKGESIWGQANLGHGWTVD